METPIPEPYDITDIPYIAWSPGLITWTIVIACLAFYSGIVWRRISRGGKDNDIKVIEDLLKELSALRERRDSLTIERTSRVARRLLSHLTGIDLIHLTATELAELVNTESHSEISEIVQVVAALEQTGYAPPSPERESSARSLIGRLITLTQAYREARRER
jgi:hypothetical protein